MINNHITLLDLSVLKIPNAKAILSLSRAQKGDGNRYAPLFPELPVRHGTDLGFNDVRSVPSEPFYRPGGYLSKTIDIFKTKF
ncbi:MAG: hypothetical protein FWD78_17790 [Treponema sp.]|nr:hypothetical protein [Treponema sp.]